jgi:hypothetical protein
MGPSLADPGPGLQPGPAPGPGCRGRCTRLAAPALCSAILIDRRITDVRGCPDGWANPKETPWQNLSSAPLG